MQAPVSDPHFYIDSSNPHLGGYIVGGDVATEFPDLWSWLVAEHGVRSVLDVGCGEGHALRYFENLGCQVSGVDGVPQEHPRIYTHDFTKGTYRKHLPGRKRFDLAWSCEFVEHVEERYVPNFMQAFRCANLVLMTHAEPNQPGYHHVNCQPAVYWIGALAAIGYCLDKSLTVEARNRATLNCNPINHFSRSGLAFVRSR